MKHQLIVKPDNANNTGPHCLPLYGQKEDFVSNTKKESFSIGLV